MLKHFSFVVLQVFILSVYGKFQESDAIHADYYFGDPVLLRRRELTCSDDLLKERCATKCDSNYYCMFSKCYCLNQNNDSNENIARTQNFEEPENHPALRHHIAHFCPNLEVARKCIRNCMKVGKPAFCGKDHVCYCGHSYENDGPDQKLDPNAIYSQFKDLYKKYFGNQNDYGEADFGEE